MQDHTGHSFAAYFKRAVSPLVVLALLREKTMYGYELTQAIEIRSDGKLGLALLYPVLYRLEEQGYIYIAETTIENGRARNYYAITDAGREHLETTAAEFQELSDALQAILNGDDAHE